MGWLKIKMNEMKAVAYCQRAKLVCERGKVCLSGGLVTSLKPVTAANVLFVFCCFTDRPSH